MFRIVLLAMMAATLMACSPKREEVAVKHQKYDLGQCIQIGDYVYKVTAIGVHSYGLARFYTTDENNKFEYKLYTFPKRDTVEQAVLTDCTEEMDKKSTEYINRMYQ